MTTATTRRRGQAAAECAIAIMLFAFAILALVEFGRVFLEGMDMMDYARQDAGEGALSRQAGESMGAKAEKFDVKLEFFGGPFFREPLKLKEETAIPAIAIGR